ncbi:CpsD/CapB family tyrosine-protein kinase [Pseudorhodobacter turbinis]|uniref:CpsD/CapB family tyrosine-protein kinase n=1 Tax=Pseudorhodobacter turbinis TaxID=2500533 RepID=A0A4P8EGT1_9RHOB|nr:CpsD/CapB family tyrosine-protein kinase [Pseudorhodobacter turbinis]QCO56118.1 CpsD/CapB family tyrosine-protein kinase [Pseudorhodobacter turbinis]
MTNRDIVLSSSLRPTDLGSSSHDDESFRKLAKETKRPRSVGVSVFRHAAPQFAAPSNSISNGGEWDRFLHPEPTPDRVWESLSPTPLDAAKLLEKGLFINAQQSSVATSFDILRTRVLHAMQQNGWRRLAITSPTHGCGKSFVATNLALSLARCPSSRTALLDLALRQPGLGALLGLPDVATIRGYLNGEQPLESHFHRFGRTLALGLNGTAMQDAAEVLHEPATAAVLSTMVRQLDPDMVVIDAPPVLGSDDFLALLPHVDAALLIIDGTKTTASEVRTCERLLAAQCPLIGVMMNRAQDLSLRRPRFGRR